MKRVGVKQNKGNVVKQLNIKVQNNVFLDRIRPILITLAFDVSQSPNILMLWCLGFIMQSFIRSNSDLQTDREDRISISVKKVHRKKFAKSRKKNAKAQVRVPHNPAYVPQIFS